jgi:hypothetical protein
MTLSSSCRTAALSFALLFTSFSTAVQAQDVIGDGFAKTAAQPNPVVAASYATMPSGDRVVFDGVSVDIYDAAGGFVMNLGVLPGFVFSSFVALDPSGTFAVIGESSNGDLFKVALDGSGFTTLANLVNNYKATFDGPTSLIVSAATCGFGCGNDVLRVDTNSGATTLLANVLGDSGPLALATNGDLYYASSFFGVPASTQIMSWTKAQLNGGRLLTEADATLFNSGWEGASSIVIDPVFGNVFITESIFGGTSRVLEFDVATGNLVDVIVESSSFLGNLELMQDTGIGHFHGYQPQDGVFMHYEANDFSSIDDIVTVRAQRPTASLTQIGPVATFQVTNAKPNSALLVLFAKTNFYDPNYITYHLNGMDFQFHAVAQVFKLRRTPLLIPTDATGTGTFSYFDGGTLAGTLVFQALITDETTKFIGSSTGALN